MTTSVWSEVTVPSPRAVRSAGNKALTAMAFVATLIGSCVLLRHCLPFPLVPGVRDKIEHLARFGDDYDALFLGSSRVHYQIIPAIFDQTAREQGLPVHSFNAGAAGMVPPEDGYVLDQILLRPHKRLRWVFLEIMPFDQARGIGILAGTGRDTYWHDCERTCLLTARTVQDCKTFVGDSNRPEVPWSEKIRYIGRQFGLWLDNLGFVVQNYSNLGRGPAGLLDGLGIPGEGKEHSPDQDKTWEGWTFAVTLKPFTEKRRADYERSYASLLETKQRFDAGDAVSWEALRAKIDRLMEEKVMPILIIPPTVEAKRYLPTQLADRSLTVLDFSDPREYPELFTLDHRMDRGHLNRDGAELFTKALAWKFLEIIKKSGPIP